MIDDIWRHFSRPLLPYPFEFQLKSDALSRVFRNEYKVENLSILALKDFSNSRKGYIQCDSIW